MEKLIGMYKHRMQVATVDNKVSIIISHSDDKLNHNAGGLVRDWNGKWMAGFAAKLDLHSGLAAEITALYLGLKLVMQMQITQTVIEMDCQNAIDLLREANNNHQLLPFILDCRDLLHRLGAPQISHVMRECNKCANLLSRDALLLALPYFH